ncbi:kinetochore-associated Ndc80 complex subunit spc25 [Nowakowskiella sp. JEL0407]|nr:kinetochore-associated Ndc80 complex subunit spc25 [Nowakowskiella sp. JEL0407]
MTSKPRFSLAPAAIQATPKKQTTLIQPKTPMTPRNAGPEPFANPIPDTFNELKTSCAAFLEEFSSWVQLNKEEVMNSQKSFHEQCDSQKVKMKDLQQKLSELQSQETSVSKALAMEKQEENSKQKEISDLKKRQIDTEITRRNLESERLELTAKLKRKTDELNRLRKYREEESRKGLPEYEAYKKWLALEIIPIEENIIRFIWTHIDQTNVDLPFTIKLDISNSELYQVMECEPELPNMGELLEFLNQTRKFYTFLILVRQSFSKLEMEERIAVLVEHSLPFAKVSNISGSMLIVNEITAILDCLYSSNTTTNITSQFQTLKVPSVKFLVKFLNILTKLKDPSELDCETIDLCSNLIARFSQLSSGRKQVREFKFRNNITVKVQEMTMNTAGLGWQTWPSSILLSNLLCSGFVNVRQKSVLELGCGTSLAGLTASHPSTGAKCVWLTDYLDEIIENCHQAIELNKTSGISNDTVFAQKLDWFSINKSNESPTIENKRNLRPNLFDVIIAADVCYEKDLSMMLPKVFAKYLKFGNVVDIDCPKVYVVVQDRGEKFFEELEIFESGMSAEGFVCVGNWQISNEHGLSDIKTIAANGKETERLNQCLDASSCPPGVYRLYVYHQG